MDMLQIAKVCHDANRSYCHSIGDNSQPEWESAPVWQRNSALKGVEFHIINLEKGNKPSPSASHESWLKEKAEDGWKFGTVKDAAKKEHPCFVPYNQLPLDQRMKDFIFSSIVEAFFTAQQSEMQAA